MTISKDQVVSINYTLTNDQGQVLDTSENRGPLSYIQGRGHIISGLEQALEGKTVGDKFDVNIPYDQAYGERNESMIQAVPKTNFQDSENVKPGMQFQVDTEHGPMVFSVLEVKDNEIVVDGNHPLAGVNLNFAVEVKEARDATEEELAHGHVHNK